MAATTIADVTCRPLTLALREPFAIASGSQSFAPNVLVELRLADGTIGWGEAAPFKAVTGETQEQTVGAVHELAATLIGTDARRWRQLALAMRVGHEQAAAARCGIECALLDAVTKRIDLPLWCFFGGAGTEVDTDMTITAGSVTHAAQSARDVVRRGITTIRIKVGGEIGIDEMRVVAVHDAAPDARLLLDGNCAYDAAAACALLDRLQARGIVPVLFEQPTPRYDWDGLCRVTRHSDVPVAADESVTTAKDALRVATLGAASCVNIKLMKAGIAEALDIAAVCRAAGLQLMIGGMVESSLAMTVNAHFAAGLGEFTFVDLDTPMFMVNEPFTGGFHQQGGRLSVAHVHGGHGVVPRRLGNGV
ncbi:MAG: dipeptide epimerase [Herpetosiphon sp.]